MTSQFISQSFIFPSWFWPAHEVYFTIIVLVIPGTIMSISYGAIAVKLNNCMKERPCLFALKEKKGNTGLVVSENLKNHG